RLNALGGDLPHLIEWAEFDRLRRTCGRASRLQVVLQAVVTEGALLRRPRVAVEADDRVGTGRDAVAAPIADVLLDEDGIELSSNDRIRRADLQAAGVGAVLADVRHHRPGDWLVRTFGRLFDEADMAPVGVVELPGVVVTVPELERVVGQAIPFLAGDLAGLAPDAE